MCLPSSQVLGDEHLADPPPYVLGIDLGVASIGWSLLAVDSRGNPNSILRTGVHIFAAGVEGNVQAGRDQARGAARREARMPRRMHWRRQRRRRKILNILQRANLLPPGDIASAQGIHDYLLMVDAGLREKYQRHADRVAAHVLPYRLRAEALDRKLEPHEFGRALYHLAQRRGFLSNRKSPKKEEDEGAVKKGISDLQASMDTAGARTLGEYFAGLDPETERIRRRWTARSMYIDEFNRMWDAQAQHHPEILTGSLRKELFQAIFFQRPLKSARHLIGRCELVPGARRAALADRLVQRFRILQKVNDLVVIPPDGPRRCLTPEERSRLLEGLGYDCDLSFAKIKSKKVLGLARGTTFNFEQDDEGKKLLGHRTDEKMRAVFGDAWNELSDGQRDSIVLEVLSFQKPDALARRAQKAWALDEEGARALAETRLEAGYAAHSRRALSALVALMENGTPYATARRELSPESFTTNEPLDRLPPVLKAIPELRNPAVARALTELRKLVHEIVRVHGKPDLVRIELARDLKRSRKQRLTTSRQIAEQTKSRDDAKARMLKDLGIQRPRRPDVEKVLLADECGWHCPYTGRQICMQTLLGEHPQFDVEHVFPFSRSLDNSFLNKTLCYHQENRDRKRNRTPHEAYAHDTTRFDEILGRVRRFHGRAGQIKFRRFEMESIPEDFVSRQLNDTRYASRLAADYVALLYGGRSDATGRLRVQVSTGGITAHLRNAWMLNALFDDLARELGLRNEQLRQMALGEKKRVNHRHHAVDALATALASPAIVQQLTRAAEQASEQGRRAFARVPEPWPGFLEEARRSILAISVSARLDKKIAGILHAETNYSKPIPRRGGAVATHVRKPLSALSCTDFKEERIVDPVVRKLVHDRWQELGGGDPKKVFAEPSTHPSITAHGGRRIPIHKVRICVSLEPRSIAKGPRQRFVAPAPGSNHHTVIVAVLRDGQETKWEDHPVTRLEVHERMAARQPIIQDAWGPDRRFKFSLAPNEYLLASDDDGTERIIRLLSVSERMNEFRLHVDARPANEARKRGSGARIILSGETMRKRNARKVRVTHCGEVIPAND